MQASRQLRAVRCLFLLTDIQTVVGVSAEPRDWVDYVTGLMYSTQLHTLRLLHTTSHTPFQVTSLLSQPVFKTICFHFFLKRVKGNNALNVFLNVLTHTHCCFTALCPGLPGWAGTRRYIHPLTREIIIHPLPASSSHLP